MVSVALITRQKNKRLTILDNIFILILNFLSIVKYLYKRIITYYYKNLLVSGT